MYLLKSKAATLAVHPIFLVYKAVKDDEYLMMDSFKKNGFKPTLPDLEPRFDEDVL